MSAAKILPFLELEKTYSSQPAPLEFVLPGLLAGTVGGLVAPGGSGKSIFALQLACWAAGGPDTLGLGQTEPGEVLYLALEDPAQLLAHRLHALGQLLSPAARSATDQKLRVAALAGAGFDLGDPDWWSAVREQAAHARLIVVDTLRQAHSRDENSGNEMKGVLQQLQQLAGPAGGVLFLHHTTKAAALQGVGDIQQASRGSSVLVDNVRSQMNLSVLGKDEAEKLGVHELIRKEYVRLSWSKVNACKPLPDRWYRRGIGGLLAPVELSATAVAHRALSTVPSRKRDDA